MNLVEEFERKASEWKVSSGSFPVLTLSFTDIERKSTEVRRILKQHAAHTRLMYVSEEKGQYVAVIVYYPLEQERTVMATYLPDFRELSLSLGDVKITNVGGFSLDNQAKVLVYVNFVIYTHMKNIAQTLASPEKKLSEVMKMKKWTSLPERTKFGSIFLTTKENVREKSNLIDLSKLDSAISEYMIDEN